MTDCKNPKACSIILRGASKDVLNEIERNLHDALGVARNVLRNPKLVPGGGALEMEPSVRLGVVAGADGWWRRRTRTHLGAAQRRLH
jgi:T-complex protein 1 subunit gamma